MKLGKWELRRRDFLRSLGVGAAMLPVLAETRAAAAETAAARRFIVMAKGNGVRAETFWPTWANGRPADGSLASATFPHVTAPLAAFRDRLVFPDGLTLRNWLKSEGNPTGDDGDSHHNWGSLLTGALPSDALFTDGGCRIGQDPPGCRMAAGGPSIDCAIGKALKQRDASVVYESLSLSVNADDLPTAAKASGMSTVSWFDRNKPNTQNPDPVDVWKKLFAGFDPTASGPDPKLRDRLRLLDFVGKDLQRFAKRLGREDRPMIEAHLDAVSRRQQQLAQIVGTKLSCKVPAAPSLRYVVKAEAQIPMISRFMVDVLVDAMKCGLTRTGAISLYDTNAYWAFFTWLADVNPNFQAFDGGPKISEYPTAHFHAMTHASGSDPGKTMFRDANRWQIEQLAYLLQRLAAEPDVDGDMLGSTLVLWVDSASSVHGVRRLPWILAGGAGGALSMGRHLQLAADTATNALFVSIASAMGVAPADGVFGDAKFGKGPLAA